MMVMFRRDCIKIGGRNFASLPSGMPRGIRLSESVPISRALMPWSRSTMRRGGSRFLGVSHHDADRHRIQRCRERLNR